MEQIPWAKPNYWGNEIKYVNDALETTWISGGKYIDRLEEEFEQKFNQKYALAVSNGTTAIHLAYLALGLKPGDEIIVPGFGFLAAANIALHMGLKPVFAEIDKETWCLSTNDLSRYTTKKTKAIVPVHTYGNVCNMDEICQFSKSKGIKIIEDCAESVFSKYDKKYCGTFGELNTFSFQATKTITTGEGGLVTTNVDGLNEIMTLYRSHGMRRENRYYWHELPGHNFRLTNIQAAMGVAQLEQLNFILSERNRVYLEYKKHLGNIQEISLQKFEPKVEPVVWAIALKIDTKAFPQGRDMVIEQLKNMGIESRPGFYASGLLNIYEKQAQLPICEDVSKNTLSLPSYPTLQNEQIEYISKQLIKLKK